MGRVSHQTRQTDSSGLAAARRAHDEPVRIGVSKDAPEVLREFAHEVNNSLSAIMSYIKATKRTIETLEASPLRERVHAFLASAADETLRAGAIVRNLRWLDEKRIQNRTSEDLNALVHEAVASIADGDPKLRVDLDLDPDLPAVMIDKVRMQQVLTHLVRNALEAMADARPCVLSIATRYDVGFIELCVTDTGAGFAPNVSERMFQPFVTTKEKRVGLGLAICKAVVEAHGGEIWAIGHQPRGAGLVFRLPIENEGEVDS